MCEITNNPTKCRPILKWAGGKSQLLSVLNQHYPADLIAGNVDTYIEPFVGGGAVFFDIINKFKFKNVYLFDINPELIILYNSLKSNVAAVIEELAILELQYLSKSAESRQAVFYDIREQYNSEMAVAHQSVTDAKRAAMTIFLNRTCFNGLFRVNRKGWFNVPHGRYKNPTILFKEKLQAASLALQQATIKIADFAECENYISGKTFIYYDPPYRPLNKTSQFTSYAKAAFDDAEQIRLATAIKKLDRPQVYQLLSNSDPTNYVDDRFFDNLYRDYKIFRVAAKRMINSKGTKRGNLREILVRNY